MDRAAFNTALLPSPLAAVAVKPPTQRSNTPDCGGRRGVVVSDLSQRGVVDVEQLSGRHVT